MKIRDIYNILEQISPFELQEKWDNSGLLVGSMDSEVDRFYVCLDIEEQMLLDIEPNSLVITHHPLIFSPLKRINFDSFATKMLKILIEKNIALISMHTNFDKTHLNRYVAQDILSFEIKNSEDFICYADIDMSFEELCKHLKSRLNISDLKVVEVADRVQKVAITTGSGMSLIDSVEADCFLTGDIKYHDAMEAKARGISLIDIGHYESEIFFEELLKSLLQDYLQKNQLKDIISKLNNPFKYV
jgi:dinuclear metal center YbgI/SA1388 family protein